MREIPIQSWQEQMKRPYEFLRTLPELIMELKNHHLIFLHILE